MESILATLNIKRIPDNFSVIKGTIYGGNNPKFRIYDKIKEIKNSIKKEECITEYEKDFLKLGKLIYGLKFKYATLRKRFKTS